MYRHLREIRPVQTERERCAMLARRYQQSPEGIAARRAERLAGFMNHAGQAMNDLFCLVLLSLSSALMAAAAWLARVESEWVDVKVKGDGR